MLRQILLCRYGKALTDKHKVELQFVLLSPSILRRFARPQIEQKHNFKL